MGAHAARGPRWGHMGGAGDIEQGGLWEVHRSRRRGIEVRLVVHKAWRRAHVQASMGYGSQGWREFDAATSDALLGRRRARPVGRRRRQREQPYILRGRCTRLSSSRCSRPSQKMPIPKSR